jgi:ribonuclease VapC
MALRGCQRVVLDSSAIVAIHLRESGYLQLADQMEAAEVVVVGTPTLLETITVLTARLGMDARPLINTFLGRFQVEVVPFTQQHLDMAVTAFLRYGRGRHPAALNFGDCMSYAVAAIAQMPLLFTGNDFARTDIV